MACVFTKVAEKLSHLNTIKEGLLTHSDDVLEEIWKQYDKKLWSFEENQTDDPPVLSLLLLTPITPTIITNINHSFCNCSIIVVLLIDCMIVTVHL